MANYLDTTGLTYLWGKIKAYMAANYAPIGGAAPATGAEVNTGTDNTKMVTPKAVADSNIVFSANGTVANVITLTKAQYDALTPAQKSGNTYIVTDEIDLPTGLASASANGLMPSTDKVFVDASKALFLSGVAGEERKALYYSTTIGDCNDIVDEWHLGGNGSANYPVVGGSVWWYVHTISYTAVVRKQIAYGYSGIHQGRVFTRNCIPGGSWTAWVEVDTGYYENIAFTYNSPFSNMLGYFRHYPATRLVTFNAKIDCTTLTINTVYPVITFSTDYAPPLNSTPLASIYGSVTGHTSAYVAADGIIRFSTSVATTSIYINGSWYI